MGPRLLLLPDCYYRLSAMASPTGGSLRGFIAGGKGMNLPPGAKSGTANFIKKPLPKQRKDPNAPKNPISAYMYFTGAPARDLRWAAVCRRLLSYLCVVCHANAVAVRAQLVR